MRGIYSEDFCYTFERQVRKAFGVDILASKSFESDSILILLKTQVMQACSVNLILFLQKIPSSYIFHLLVCSVLDQDCCPALNTHVEKLIPVCPSDTLLSHASDSYSSKKIADVQPKLQLYEYCLGCGCALLSGCYQEMPHLHGKLF